MSTSAGTVTLRAPWSLLVIALPVLGLFDVGIIWGVVSAVHHHDAGYPFRGDGFHTTGIVVGWFIAGIMLTVCLFASVNLVVLRVHFEGDHIRMRKLYRYVTIRLDDLTSVIVTNPQQWQVSAPRSSVAPCLEIRGRRRSGRPAYIGINAKLLDYQAGLLWLAPWLRAHPTITDERTLALLDGPPTVAPESAPRDTPQASIPAEDLMTKYRDDLR